MGFRVDSFANIWGAEEHKKFTKVRLSIGRYVKDGVTPNGFVSNGYETTFSDFVALIGHAHNKFKGTTIPEGSCVKIKILNCDVTQTVINGKKYNNYSIFDFEFTDNDNNPKDSTYSKKQQSRSSFSRNKTAAQVDTDEYDDPFS